MWTFTYHARVPNGPITKFTSARRFETRLAATVAAEVLAKERESILFYEAIELAKS